MNLNIYQTEAKKTAIYRYGILHTFDRDRADWVSSEDAGGAFAYKAMRLLYVQAGLMEEICELITHVDEGPSVEGMLKEMGDVVWYISAWCSELECTLQAAFKVGIAPPLNIPGSRLLTRLIKQARFMPGLTKRLVRDHGGELDDDQRTAALVAAGGLLRTMMALADYYQVFHKSEKGFDAVLTANLEKLKDRQSRDVIKGHGDNR